MRVLVSGFEAFNGEEINPTALMIEAIQAGKIASRSQVEVRGIILPVSYQRAYPLLAEAIQEFRPQFVLAFGLAGGRKSLELERVAINCRDTSIPDNAGLLIQNSPIDPAGPTAYFTTLPIHALIRELGARGISCKISNSAGTYVCNDVFYRLLQSCEDSPTGVGFIHVPWHPRQIKTPEDPSLELEEILRALEIILEFIEDN